MQKTCKNGKKPDHFAKMCRSQQKSETMEDSDKSEEECDLIKEVFESCRDFEIVSIQPHLSEGERISREVGGSIHERNATTLGEKVSVQKIDLLRDPTSNEIKSLKAMVRIDNQIIQLTVDTGSSEYFLNWSTRKEIIDKSKRA